MTISADGKVSACSLGKGSGFGVLDTATERLGGSLSALIYPRSVGKRFSGSGAGALLAQGCVTYPLLSSPDRSARCGGPLDVWAAVPAKSVFGNFGVVRIGGAVLVRKDPVSRSRLVAEFSPAVPGFSVDNASRYLSDLWRGGQSFLGQSVLLVYGARERQPDRQGERMHHVLRAFFQNARKPGGLSGRIMLWAMNCGHASLAKWGRSHVSPEPDARVLDIGCGGGGESGAISETLPARVCLQDRFFR